MNYALDSCCVFDPVAHVGLFLHLHLASLLPGLELCPSPKLPMLLPYTLLQCRHHVYRLRRHFWAPNVWTAANIRAALIHGWKKWEPRKPRSLQECCQNLFTKPLHILYKICEVWQKLEHFGHKILLAMASRAHS